MIDPLFMIAAIPLQRAAPWPRCLEIQAMAAGIFNQRFSRLLGLF
jgi:hypothetical protein